MVSLNSLLAAATTFLTVSAGISHIHARNNLAIRADLPLSQNGICGAYNGTASCLNSGFGNCCSQFGYCGSDTAHCGVGCQTQYGACGAQPPPPTWSVLGCYTDNTNQRTLNTSILVAGNTVEKCQAACAGKGFNFAGTEFGSQCFCGTAIQAPGAISEDGGCVTPCPGNNNQVCGGANKINVYTVVPVWQNLGCYTDTSNSRTLNTSMLVGGNTVEKCQNVCQNAGFKYSGTEFGSQCFCGNAIMNQGVPVSDGCTKECQGNPLQVCGGGNRLSMYTMA